MAQKELVVSFGRRDQEMTVEIFSFKIFPNNEKGFKLLTLWAEQIAEKSIPVRYVMEATGVYHEPLAYYLADSGFDVSIVLPNKISNFFRTLDVNTITDKTASQAIARFGLERKLDVWQKPKRIFSQLKQLTREREQLVAERTMLKNQLHAERAEALPNPRSIERLNKRVELLNAQEKEIKIEIAETVKQDKQLVQQIEMLTSIPGVGQLTAVIALAETNGFDLIRNKRQLVSYAGLDIREKQSGTSVKGKARISKKGNRYLRKAMHLPALSAIRNNERFKAIFIRLVSKHGIKMKAAVAIQRKLIELIYVIWKTNRAFDKHYSSPGTHKAA